MLWLFSVLGSASLINQLAPLSLIPPAEIPQAQCLLQDITLQPGADPNDVTAILFYVPKQSHVTSKSMLVGF